MVLTSTFALLWAIWNCKNDIVFGRKNINDPIGIVKRMCSWITDWAILQKKDPGERMLTLGARLIEQAASEIFKASQGWRFGVPRLQM